MDMETRRQQLMHHIIAHNTISVNQLIEIMQESPATIRRDLVFLEKNGYISRTRGYVRHIQPDIVNQIDISVEKIAVAIKAAEMIPVGTTVFIDSGVSGLALAQQIKERTDITVYTNSLSVANVLAATNVSTYMTGGFLEGRQEALVGPEAEAYIRSMRFPIVFLTTTGIRNPMSLACVTPFQANLKSSLIHSGEKVILLADAAKFETDSLRVFGSFKDLSTVIVDSPIRSKEQVAALEKCGVEVIVARDAFVTDAV